MKHKADRGGGPVEFAVLALPILVLTFIVVQAAFVFYARSTALAAATQGANAARAYNAPANAGVNKANDFLGRVGGGLRNPTVTYSSTATTATVTVTGKAQTIIPGLTFNVTQSASGPVERFVS
ncbi:TadE family protein [Rhizocola hellebori]|nr:TadE family protein [Rhizocola hellebori]